MALGKVSSPFRSAVSQTGGYGKGTVGTPAVRPPRLKAIKAASAPASTMQSYGKTTPMMGPNPPNQLVIKG